MYNSPCHLDEYEFPMNASVLTFKIEGMPSQGQRVLPHIVQEFRSYLNRVMGD